MFEIVLPSVVYQDFVNLSLGKRYEIAHPEKKDKVLFSSASLFPVTMSIDTFSPPILSKIPYSYHPYRNVPLHRFDSYIPYLLSWNMKGAPTALQTDYEENGSNSFVCCFVKEKKHENHMLYDVQCFLAKHVFLNISDRIYLLYSKPQKQFTLHYCKVTPEEFHEYQKEILFSKAIFYHIHSDPSQWTSKWFPSFSSTNEVLKDEEKVNLAKQVGELSLLVGINFSRRQRLHEQGIVSFHDPRIFEFLTEKEQKKNRSLLYINRLLPGHKPPVDEWMYLSSEIRNNEMYVQVKKLHAQKKLLYLDFEYDYASFGVYLCGIINCENEKIIFWSDRHEQEVFRHLYDFLKKNPDYGVLYYSADKATYKKLFEKYHEKHEELCLEQWYDLYHLVCNYCAFYGSFSFGIKSIMKSFSKHSEHENPYEKTSNDSKCCSGMESIFMFRKYLHTKIPSLKDEIIAYNMDDCKVQQILFETILNYETTMQSDPLSNVN